MKIKLQILICLLVSAAFSFSAFGQNLDPTVEVNRAYEGKLMEVHKPSLSMAVPDSLLRFDLDFDYSVFDNPYKGAYEFRPYAMELQPVKRVEENAKFYLKAGAGYRLHPTLDLVWGPLTDGPFKLNVHASNRSYIGAYRVMADPQPELSDGPVEIGRKDRRSSYGDNYDVLSIAGVDGRYDWEDYTGYFDVAYYGLQQKDRLHKRSYDGLDAGLRFRSKDPERFLVYDLKADYRLGYDKLSGTEDRLKENVVSVAADLGMELFDENRMFFDFAVDVNSYSGSINTGVTRFTMVPHYVFGTGPWSFDLGVRVAALVKVGASDSLMYRTTPGQIVYPDINVSYDVIQDMMKAYFKAGGGAGLNSYASLLSKNHHFDMNYGRGHWGLLDNTVERVSATLGLKGRVGEHLGYDLRVGYALYANEAFESIAVVGSRDAGELRYVPGVGYASCQKVFAALDWNWAYESFRFDGSLLCSPWTGLDAPGMFAPAVLAGDVAFAYNWNKRLYAGIDCQFSTFRKGSVLYSDGFVQAAKVPGYADLGLNLEYKTSSTLSVWLRGGNLLDMTIQRNLLYAEDGIYFTAGVCLNL